nr:hypothetical protein [Thermodesulforhabdus norvegica]
MSDGPDRRTVNLGGAAIARGRTEPEAQAGMSLAGSPRGVKRHFVGPAYRFALERPAGSIPAIPDVPLSIPTPGEDWAYGDDFACHDA